MAKKQTPEQARAEMAQRFRKLVAWSAKLRGYGKVPDHHWYMADFLEGTELRWIRRAKVILGGRFLAKTWLGARCYIKWRWLRCPWTQVIVHSSNDKMAGRFVAAIKDELRTDPLTAHLVPKRAGSSDYEFTLEGVEHEQGASIVCAGIKTSMTGSRADLYLFDDPEPDTEPEAVHDRLLEAFGEAGDILHSPARHLPKMGITGEVPVPERTQLVVLGQPHCAATAYIPTPEDFDDEADGHPLVDAVCLNIPTVKRGANMKSIAAWRWPEMAKEKYGYLTPGAIPTPARVRRSMARSRWELQHMLNTDFMLKAGPCLRLYEIETTRELPARNILVIDPADSEEGCEWGVVVLGLHKGKIHISWLGGFIGEAYEGDDWEGMSGSVWRQIFDIGQDFGCREAFLEQNLKAATSACRRYISKNDIGMVVTEFAAKRNKKVRIPETLEPIINNRMVSAHPQVLGDRVTNRQLTKLRWDKLPKPNDRLDVLAHGVTILVEEPALFAAKAAAAFPELEDENLPEQFQRTAELDNPFLRLVR